jgi:hypothetical protein
MSINFRAANCQHRYVGLRISTPSDLGCRFVGGIDPPPSAKLAVV